MKLKELKSEIKKSKDRLHSIIIVSRGDTGKQALAELSNLMKLIRKLIKFKEQDNGRIN